MAEINLENVSVKLPIYGAKTRSLKMGLMRKLKSSGRVSKDPAHNILIINALDNLSINLKSGDRVGLIGENGAGKSTLLKILAQIYYPTTGIVNIQGNVSTLFDVTLGISDECSGYENIFIGGVLRGFSHKIIKKNLDKIAEFTELGDYLSMPVRTYSSGMRIRLAFAIATTFEPEILLLDEIIGVGDQSFIKKAQQRLLELVHKSDIVILASHNPEIVTKLCNKILILNSGKLVYFGDDFSSLS